MKNNRLVITVSVIVFAVAIIVVNMNRNNKVAFISTALSTQKNSLKRPNIFEVVNSALSSTHNHHEAVISLIHEKESALNVADLATQFRYLRASLIGGDESFALTAIRQNIKLIEELAASLQAESLQHPETIDVESPPSIVLERMAAIDILTLAAKRPGRQRQPSELALKKLASRPLYRQADTAEQRVIRAEMADINESLCEMDPAATIHLLVNKHGVEILHSLRNPLLLGLLDRGLSYQEAQWQLQELLNVWGVDSPVYTGL